MASADDKDEIIRLRAQLREAELRLQERERDWHLLESQRRHSEQMFIAAFDESPEAIGLSRLSDGLIVDVNQEWLTVTGYSRDEVIGHTVVEIGHWADQASREAAIAALRVSGRLRDHEAIVAFKDQRKHLVRLNGTLINVGGVQHILMYVKDITAERMAQESMRSGELALAQANEQLSQQLALHELTERLAGVGYWIASADGQQIVWSKGLRMIRGMDPDNSPPMTS